MGYLFLSISLLAGIVKGYCGKKLGGFAANYQSAVLLNFVRMLLCVALGVMVVFASGDAAYLTATPGVLMTCALSGIGTAFFVVSWLLAVRKSAYMMLDVFLMVGTVIPMIGGYVRFAETIRHRQWIGFFLLVVAAVVMCSYHNSVKTKLSLSSFALLLACGAMSGIADFSQKLYVKSFPSMPISVFNLYTYVFAAATLAIVFLLRSGKEKTDFDRRPAKAGILLVIMAVALTANSYFKTMAARDLDSAQLYPLSQGAALVLSSVMATVCFQEKFTRKAFVGIVLAFVALMIMNL